MRIGFHEIGTFVFLLLVIGLWSPDIAATSCRQFEYPESAKIEVDSGEWDEHHEELREHRISLPAELLGEPLRELNIWMSTDKSGADVDLIAPLAFEVEAGVATAKFVSRRGWPHVSITAGYGHDTYCGPRLAVDISQVE